MLLGFEAVREPLRSSWPPRARAVRCFFGGGCGCAGQVSVPAGALVQNTTITVSTLSGLPATTAAVPPSVVGTPLVFQPAGLHFLANVLVTLPYNATLNATQAGGGAYVLVHKLVSDGVGIYEEPIATSVRWQPVGPSSQPAAGSTAITTLVSGFSTLAAVSLPSYPSCTATPLPKGCGYQFPHSRQSSAGVEVYLTLAALAFLWLVLLLAIFLPACCKCRKYMDPEEEEEEEAPPPLPAPLPISPPPPPAPIVFVREMEPERRFNENGSLIKHYGAPIHRKTEV